MIRQQYIDIKTTYLNLQQIAGGVISAQKTFTSIANRDNVLRKLLNDNYFTDEGKKLNGNELIEKAFAIIRRKIHPKLLDIVIKYYLNDGLGVPNSLNNLERFTIAAQKLSVLKISMHEYTILDDVERYIKDNILLIERLEVKTLINKRIPPPPVVDVDYKVALHSDKTIIYEILSLYGSVYYGRGANWCTVTLTENNMCNHYLQFGTLYIIKPIDKKEIYQLHNESPELMDANNNPVNLNYLMESFNDSSFNKWVQYKKTEYYSTEIKNENDIDEKKTNPNKYGEYNIAMYKQIDKLIENNKMDQIITLILSINITPFTDLDNILSSMTRLQSLTFHGMVYDLGTISRLSKLKQLSISNHTLYNIDLLERLTNLEELGISNDKKIDNILNIDVLNSLRKLKKLSINNNKLTTIAPLSGLTELEELDIGNTNISDIAPLNSLRKLKKLAINDNELTTIAPLSGLTELEELNIVNCPAILDIEILNSMPKLKNLFVGGHNVFDTSAINNNPLLIINNVVYERDILADIVAD